MDQSDLLRQLSSDIREFRSEINAKVDTISTKLSDLDKQQSIQGKDIEFIKQEDSKQNKLLDEHIEGVNQVREQNQLMKDTLLATFQAKATELEKRLKKLEGPGQWLKQTLWLIVTAGSIAYAIYYVSQLIHLLPK